MRLTLRTRVLLLVFLINAVLFAVGGFSLMRAEEEGNRRSEEGFADLLGHALKSVIDPQEEIKTDSLLEWPNWTAVEDAILVGELLGADGTTGLNGIKINPVGCGSRPLDFDRQGVDEALLEAYLTDSAVDVAGGWAVPIPSPVGDVWGACWYRRDGMDRGPIARQILLYFLVSTLVLTGGTFLALRSLVLDPVRRLAAGAQRVRSGDLTYRVPEPLRRDEVADLVRAFNEMTRDVSEFNARLEREVAVATTQARQAEQAAMTQRRLAAMGTLAAGIAHEINNPLGGLQNALESLQAGGLDPAREKQYLALLRGGLDRIGRTVSQLLRFTPRDVVHADVDLEDVAGDALDLVRHRAERLGSPWSFGSWRAAPGPGCGVPRTSWARPCSTCWSTPSTPSRSPAPATPTGRASPWSSRRARPRWWCAWGTTAPASRPRTSTGRPTCSTPPRTSAGGPAWAWPWSTTPSPATAAAWIWPAVRGAV